MDSNLVLWSSGGKLCYTLLRQGDISVFAGGIRLSEKNPHDRYVIDVAITVLPYQLGYYGIHGIAEAVMM